MGIIKLDSLLIKIVLNIYLFLLVPAIASSSLNNDKIFEEIRVEVSYITEIVDQCSSLQNAGHRIPDVCTKALDEYTNFKKKHYYKDDDWDFAELLKKYKNDDSDVAALEKSRDASLIMIRLDYIEEILGIVLKTSY